MEFYMRYRLLAPSIRGDDPTSACKALVQQLSLEKGQFQYGTTKLFLKAGQVNNILMICFSLFAKIPTFSSVLKTDWWP